MSNAGWQERFTLVVPTYNRHAELKRLLVLLQREGVAFRVLVLDSSEAGVRAQNAALVRALRLRAAVSEFPPETPPFEKFARGAEQVETDFAALCADDDVLVPSSLPALVGHLAAHADHAAAHGWYFAFNLGETVDVTRVVYRGDSLDDDQPLQRLHACLRRYEALTYAVYRTPVLRRALAAGRKVATIMERELVGGVIATVSGKVARLPVLYYGRSLAPSHSYGHWHPLNFLATRPATLFENYPAYRAVVLEALTAAGPGLTPEALEAIVDLAHLRYLAEYAKPRVLDELVAGKIAGRPLDRLVGGALPLLVDGGSRLERYARETRWVRELRMRLFPRLKLFHLKRLLARTEIESRTAGGAPRSYRYGREFMAAVAAEPALRAAPEALARLLDGYE